MNTQRDVALILWNRDNIQLMSMVLHTRDLKSCGIEPFERVKTMEDLISSCSASVVVFDLGPPYDRSAAVVMRLLDQFPNRSFVMTCADISLALKNAPWLSRYHLFEKPYELNDIADTIHSMVRSAARSVTASAGA